MHYATSPRIDSLPRGRTAATARFWMTVLLVLLVDQSSKGWARGWLLIGAPSVTLIPGAISLDFAPNPGLAFGLCSGYGAVLNALAAAAACAIAPWPDLVRLPHAPSRSGASGL